MNLIWANRLIAGTKTWEDVPALRKESVKSVLIERVISGEITSAKYTHITGEEYPQSQPEGTDSVSDYEAAYIEGVNSI